MAVSAWVVGIRLITTSNMGLVAANMNRHLDGVNAKTNALKSNLGGLSPVMRGLDHALTGIGIAAAATFAIGVKGASDLQNATLQSGIAMGRLGDNLDDTLGRMKEFRQVAMDMSKMTGQSIAQSMTVVSRMASSGLSAGQIKEDYKPIAQFGDILKMGKDHMDYEKSAVLGAGLVHELRMYTAKDTAYGLGELAQLGYLSPHGTTELATQIRMAAPQMMNMLPGDNRKKAAQIMEYTAWADRMGGLQRFGSGVSQLITNMVNPRSARAKDSLHELGIYTGGHKDKKGHWVEGTSPFMNKRTGEFDMMGAFQSAANTYRDAINKPGGRAKALEALMGLSANASRYLQLFTGPDAANVLANVRKQHGAMGDPVEWMNKVQTEVMSTLSGQTIILTSNFQTMATLLTEQLLPVMTSVVHVLQETIGRFNQTLMDHPKTAAVGGVALGALGLYGLTRLALGGANVLHAFTTLGKHAHGGVSVGHWAGRASHAMGGAEAVVAKGVTGGLLRGGKSALFGALGVGLFTSIKALYKSLGPLMKGFGAVGRMTRVLGLEALTSGGGLRVLGMLIGKVGLRAIPVVGNLLLLIDTIRFLGTHSFDIGKGIGIAVKWIVAHGIPLIVSAFKSLVMEIWNFIKDSFAGIFLGGKGGFVGALENMRDGIIKGFKEEDNQKRYIDDQRRLHDQKNYAPVGSLPVTGAGPLKVVAPTKVVTPVTYDKANLALPLGNSVGAGPRLGKTVPLPRLEKPVPAVHKEQKHGNQVANVELKIIMPPLHGASDAEQRRSAVVAGRKAADVIASVFSSTFRTSGRAAGANPAMAGASVYEYKG